MTKLLFFFSTTKIGGAETNILKISRELVKHGFEVHFASLANDGNMLDMVDFPLASYTEIGDYRRHLFSAVSKYKKLIKEEEINVVSNFGQQVESFSRPLSKLFGVKMVISNIRSVSTHRKRKNILIDRLTSPFVDKWVSNSIAAKNVYHEREKYPLEKIDVVYNYIDITQQDIPDKSFKYRIGVLANIHKYKGYYDLIPIANELMKQNLDFHFYIGGQDNTNNDFYNEVKKQGLSERFSFLGFVKNKEEFFNNVDVFFLPSYLEGMPTVILEAMQYGVPVVASNVGGIPEQIENGYNGFMCKPGDIGGFVDAIKRIENTDVRERFIANSYNILTEKFSKEKIVEKWIKIFSNH